MTEVKGTHPYADEFPMASEEELQELTESIATVGLIHAVILTEDGLVLDGRNRLEACRRAEVEPTFEVRDGDDDDFKEFVIGVNTTGRRESMTVQIAAASTALILGAESRTEGGRWHRKITQDLGFSGAESEAMRQCGLVLDVLGPDVLRRVRDGEVSLNAAYTDAQRAREDERRAMEDEQRVTAEEDEAKAYLEGQGNAGEYILDVTNGLHKSYRHARAAYLEDHRREKAKQERERRERDESLNRSAARLKSYLHGYAQAWGMRDNPDRDDILNHLNREEKARFLKIEGDTSWPTTRH